VGTTPAISARTLVRLLKKPGFAQTRSRGSHRRFEHPNRRKTMIPVHKGRDIPRGLLRQIITVDLEMSMDESMRLL
jgi:predicted RNA binding protein YcfA (HicA-like mRNA interferase family)